MPHIARLIERHAKYRPEQEAIIFGGQRLTYRDLSDQVNRLGHALRNDGFEKGDKIACILPNSLEILELYWTTATIGGVMVPLSPLLQINGLKKLLARADVQYVVTCKAYFDLVAQAINGLDIKKLIIIDGETTDVAIYYQDFIEGASTEPHLDIEVTDDDLYNIIYSSGTTGEPKGIQHTHFIRAMYCTLFSQAFRFTPETVCMHSGAVIFNGAFVTLMPTFYNGAKYVLLDSFDVKKVVDTIAAEKVTHMMMVPAQIQAILSYPEISAQKLKSLEMIVSIGAPLPKEHKEALEKLIPGRFHELYGLTEGFVTILDKTDFSKKSGSVGCCPPFFDIRICDEQGHDLPVGEIGEIVGRSPILTPGYYNMPEKTAETIRDGWLFTGDLGYLDEDGYLFLVDRKKDMIITGGVNVYPKDIEEVIACHEAVSEVAVFGIQDQKWGEAPVCYVILKQGYELDPIEFKSWINENVEAKFQRIHEVRFVDDFPRSVVGKTLKREMRNNW